MVKICSDGKLFGFNGHYHNPEYIQKQRISQHKRYNTLENLDLSKPPEKRYKAGSGKTSLTMQEYLLSDKNPFNQPGFSLKHSHFFTLSWKRRTKTQWNDPIFRKKWADGYRRGKITLLEKRFQVFLNNVQPNEWKYVGNHKFLIEGKNPDFINLNSKKCIEIFYEYFKIRDYGSVENYINLLNDHYINNGWKCLFVSQYDFYNQQQNFVEILKQFTKVS